MQGIYVTTVVLVCTSLAVRVERVRESGLLGGVNGQTVVVLDLNPSDDVVALEGIERGEPGGGVLIALGLVEVVCDGNQLWLSKIVGELFATSGGPTAGSADPGFLQRHEVVLETHLGQTSAFEIREVVLTHDIEVRSQVCGDVIVG